MIPSRAGCRGICVTMTIAVASYTTHLLLPRASQDALPAVMLSLLFGMCVLNSPLGRWLGLWDPWTPSSSINWKEALDFQDKKLLRLAVMMQGFLLQFTELVHHPAKIIACTIVIPPLQMVTFGLAQLAGLVLQLPPDATDMLAIGTIICGASAVLTLAATMDRPHNPAHAAEVASHSAKAVTSIFVFSIVALFTFMHVGLSLHMSPELFGLWAGMAVNDLSSSLAVGSQFGKAGLAFATISKVLRILTLPFWLVFFSFRDARRAAGVVHVPFCENFRANFPLFMVIFCLNFATRVILDTVFPEAHFLIIVSTVGQGVVNFLLAMVSATIGLKFKIDLRTFRNCSRYILTESVASLGLSALALIVLLALEAIFKI